MIMSILTTQVILNLIDLKEKYKEVVFDDIYRTKFFQLKVECNDDVFHEVPLQKF